MLNKNSVRQKVERIIRIQTWDEALRTIIGAIIGTISYIALSQVKMPSYKLMGLFTIQINLAILVIPIAAAFLGPLAGFLVGFLGTLGADAFFVHQFIAFGVINLSYGILGFIAGIPHYLEGEGFSNGRILGKLIMFIAVGFLAMSLTYLVGLILVVGQNQLSALLYNFLPLFSVSLINLLVIAPVVARLVEIVLHSIYEDGFKK